MRKLLVFGSENSQNLENQDNNEGCLYPADMMSISSTFYMRVFRTKVNWAAFSLITVRLCDFLAKGYWQKSVSQMFMQLVHGGDSAAIFEKFASLK